MLVAMENPNISGQEGEPQITIINIQDSPFENVMPVITTSFMGGNQTASITKDRADKLRKYIGQPMSQERYREFLSEPVDLMD
jgi:hypothetical protein